VKKVAIVHDYLNQFGGAERVVAALHEIFPDAPIFTSIYNARKMPPAFQKMDIRTSFMKKLPFILKKFRHYFWLYPRAFESFGLSEYDLIISSSSAYAKGIIKREDAIHVCYCHNPMRFAWRYDDYIKKENIPWIAKKILPLFLNSLKKWDLKRNKGVDFFIANSSVVKNRISQFYGRDSKIIHPPIDIDKFSLGTNQENYFLIVSRLNYYKRLDIAVDAFSKLGLQLRIVGEGPAKPDLIKKAATNIDFLGNVDDNRLRDLYAKCRALIFTEEADFGMVPLEGAASGRPTIAFGRAGALETIKDDVSGLFFDEQTPESLIEAIKRFEKMKFDKNIIRQHAEKFSKDAFKRKIREFLSEIKAL